MDNKDSIRVLVFGKSDNLKNFMFDTLIGEEKFCSEISSDTCSSKHEAMSFKHKNRTYRFLDAPGLFDVNLSEEGLLKELDSAMDLLHPGPHVFIMILDLNRFTSDEKKTVQLISDIFGKNIFDHCMILFVGLDYLKYELKNHIDESNSYVKELIKLCNGLYLEINNKEKDSIQKFEIKKSIFKMIDIIALDQKKQYTVEKFKKAHQEYEEKLRKLELEREKEMKKIDKLKHECDLKVTQIREESDPTVQLIKKKWYQKFGHDIAKLFRKEK